MMLKMAQQQLLALITDVDRLITAGAESIHGHERLAAHGKAIRHLSAQVPALKFLLPLMDAVHHAEKSQRSARLLELQSCIRYLRATLAAPGELEGELQPVEQSGSWETSVPLRELVVEVWRVRTSNAHRKRVARGVAVCSTDLRMVGALMQMMEHTSPSTADAIADQVLPKLGTMIVPELKRLPFRDGNVADLRRLVALCILDPNAGYEAISKLAPDLARDLPRPKTGKKPEKPPKREPAQI